MIINTQDSLKFLVENTNDAYILFQTIGREDRTIDLTIVEISASFEKIAGYQREELLHKDLKELFPDSRSDHPDWAEVLKNTVLHHQLLSFEYFSNLNETYYSVIIIPFTSKQRLVYFLDITQTKRNESKITQKNHELIQLKKEKKEIELSEKRYKTLVNNLGDIIYTCNLRGMITMVNKMFCQLTGKTEKKILGTRITDYFNPENTAIAWDRAIAELMLTGEPAHLEYQYFLPDGSSRFYYATLSPISDLNKKIVGFIGSNHDITSLKINEQKMISLAYHDSLTKLPNKTLFLDRLRTAISIAERNKVKIGVAFVDLDNFKELNAVYGHDHGDKLLFEVAQKLVSCVRSYDTVARFGEDKFLVLFQHLIHVNELFTVFERIRLALFTPFSIGRHSISLTASIGIGIYPDDGVDANEIILNANTAMDKAKKMGKNCYYFYNDQFKEALNRQNMLRTMLISAMNNQEFLLYYQPQYEIPTRRLRGFEALLRWNNPAFGLILPVEFIKIAEETKQIIPLGKWVIKNACEVCKMINDKYGLNLIVSVNISLVQLQEKDFFDTIMETVKHSGIKPSNLELDIKENVIMENFDYMVSVLKKLKKAGIRIALDDFGLSNLSLSQLKRLPLDMVKLDKELLNYIEYPNSQGALTDSIIDLIHHLDIEMLAEGVENKEQVDYLLKGNCDNIQGFFFAEPVAREKIEEIIEKGVSENEAQSRMIQKIGLTYEELFKQPARYLGKNWDIRQ